MKELSIEEKAKRYDEAIELARKILKTIGNATLGNLVLKNEFERMFPELAESEDDRIRGAIIGHLKDNNLTEWAAWLEKQCEQKPADKVEPKFKVGDWIISHYNHVAYIKSIGEKYYFLSLSDGNSAMLSIDCIDKNWRLWTIQDAKNGDVLVRGEQLFLFKRMNTSNSFYAHCHYHFIGYSSLSVFHCSYSIDNIYPATKEQRSLLLQKMKEAGYEWDAVKKELNKLMKE